MQALREELASKHEQCKDLKSAPRSASGSGQAHP